MRHGLKLFSTNQHYLLEARRLYEAGIYHYIELYAYPDTYEATLQFWKNLNIPFIIHAAHFGHGMNLAKAAQFESNRRLAEEAFRFADALCAPKVIFHPGVAGDTHETICQMKKMFDPRMLIENKPYYSVDKKWICNGWSPEEIQSIIEETGAGFCLDFGHALCAANAQNRDPFLFLDAMLALKPALFHLTDGDFKGDTDRHLHFGEGDYPIQKLLKLIPKNSLITNEAAKAYADSLSDFEKDMAFLKSLEGLKS